MMYALRAAEKAVKEYNLAREQSPAYNPAEHGAVSLRTIAEVQGFDTDSDIVMDIDYAVDWDWVHVKNMKVTPYFKRLIAMFGIVKTQADRSTAFLIEKDLGSKERLAELERWVKSQDRLYTKAKSPPFASSLPKI